jgi:hypothetical protein
VAKALTLLKLAHLFFCTDLKVAAQNFKKKKEKEKETV